MRMIVAILLSVSYFNAGANVGIFAGDAHTIRLDSTEKVQMVSEVVDIYPNRSKGRFDGSLTYLDRVRFNCQFTLKNLTDQSVTIQVGFPLNSGANLFPKRKSVPNVEDLLVKYSFIAQSAGQVFSPRFYQEDSEGQLDKVFVWDLKFSPNEEKQLRVSYELPISTSLAHTSIDPDLDFEEWLVKVDLGLLEWTKYVTQTGRSWAGLIEKAIFRLHDDEFVGWLDQRGIWEEKIETQSSEIEESIFSNKFLLMPKRAPDGWQRNPKGWWQLEYTDYQADSDLEIQYWFLPFPNSVSELERIVRLANAVDKRSEWEGFEVSDLLNIFYAYNGEDWKSDKLKPFIENQIWLEVADRPKIPQAVIDTLERLVKR